jgi:hypothetical protein
MGTAAEASDVTRFTACHVPVPIFALSVIAAECRNTTPIADIMRTASRYAILDLR